MPKGSSRHCKGPENAGLSVALDDFGTGYAALTHLKALPINRIKIDKPFVRDTKLDQEDAAIVSATVGLAHALSLGVVAEGVECPEQAQFLHACGCDVIQCFLCSACTGQCPGCGVTGSYRKDRSGAGRGRAVSLMLC